MRPVLFHIGSLGVSSYYAMWLLGLIFAIIVTAIEGRKSNFSWKSSAVLWVFCMFSGWLASRPVFLLAHPDRFSGKPLELLCFWMPGQSWHGGLLGGILALYIFSRIEGLSFWKLGDITAPGIAVLASMCRMGCFLFGCCYGRLTSSFLGIEAVNPLMPSGIRHPTQLYEGFLDFGLYIFLVFWSSRKKADGELFLLYFIIYSGIRFIVEFFRESGPYIGSLSLAQWISLVIIAGGIILFRKLPHRVTGS